jgi:hypothetical protein
MRKVLGITILGILVVALTAAMCGKKGNMLSPVSEESVSNCTISGDTITVYNPRSISNYCNDTIITSKTGAPDTVSLMELDTVVADTVILTYALSNNGKTLVTNVGDSLIDTFSREGGGSGIQGAWLESYIDGCGSSAYIYTAETQIGPKTITYSTPGYCAGTDAVAQWDCYDDTLYTLRAAVVNCNAFSLTDGNGKTLTTSLSSNGNVTYSSNFHASYTYLANPTTCPDEYYPEWVDSFYNTNSISTAKRTAAARAMLPVPHRSIGPRFARVVRLK